MTSITLPRSNLTTNITGWQGGSGPSLLLIHGVGLNADAWGPMLPFLTKKFSVTAVDMPGHGSSTRLSDPAQLTAFSDRISQVLTGPTFVVGHSMGALISMDIALRYSSLVSAVAPMNAIYRRSDEASRAVKLRANKLDNNTKPDPGDTLIRWFGVNPQNELATLRDDCRKWLCSVDPEGYSQAYTVFANEDAPSDEALRDLSCPALFITGEDEPNSTPFMSDAMAQIVPNGQSVIINSARHMMPMTHAKNVSDALCKFYQECEALRDRC